MRYFPKMDWHISTPSRAKIHLTGHTVAGAPDALNGLRVLFASDFHMRRGMDAGQIADAMNACRADLILLGGDYADTRGDALALFDAFRRLRAPLGIFAARGNNDSEAFDSEADLARSVAAFGARLLVNDHAAVAYNGARLLVGGIDEYLYGAPDCARTFCGKEQADYRILLSHYPIFPENRPLPDLILCGHTHGGQFCAFGLNPYSIGFECLSKKQLPPALVSGSLHKDGAEMIVSKGIGVSRIPLRIGVRPEIHLLTFQNTSCI